MQCRFNCSSAIKFGQWIILYPLNPPSWVQITSLICQKVSRDLEPCNQVECSCSYFSQNKRKRKITKYWSKGESPPQIPSYTAHMLTDRGNTWRWSPNLKVLLYSAKPLNDVRTYGLESRAPQTGGTGWQRARDEGRNKEERKRKSFHQVHAESQLLPCWWVSQNSELLSWEKLATCAGRGQLMSHLLTLILPLFLHPQLKMWHQGRAICACPECIFIALKMWCY